MWLLNWMPRGEYTLLRLMGVGHEFMKISGIEKNKQTTICDDKSRFDVNISGPKYPRDGLI